MRKSILTGLVVCLALMFGSLAMADSNPAITSAPTDFTGTIDCSSGDCILNLMWTPLSSTPPSNLPVTKYAVEVEVSSLSLAPTSCPDTMTVADYDVLPSSCTNTTDGCSLSVDLTSAGLIPAGYTLISVTSTVKGMVTPVKGGSGFSSNNALSMLTIDVNPCP